MEPAHDTSTLFVRGMPKALLAKLKAAAALKQQTLGEYLQQVLGLHIQELERTGFLPKNR